jgi:LacI family transcriptional regulator
MSVATDSTLKDVAHASGVSIRTVKRALSGVRYVNSKTRDRVLAVAARLKYEPNLGARSLKTGRSFEIGVMLTSMDELFMGKLEAFERTLRPEGYSVHVLFAPAETRAADVPEVATALMARRPAGVGLFPDYLEVVSSGVAERLNAAGIPTVVLDSRRETSGDRVLVDRPQGVYEAMMHLAQTGRRRVAYLGPISDRSRLDGYEKAMRKLGQSPLLVPMHGTVAAAVEQLLSLQPRPDAVQTYSDVIAMDVLAALHRRGVRVPAEMAVVGFDDRAFASLSWPKLTTVAQPNADVGVAGAEILLARIAGRPAPGGRWVRTCPTCLVVRESA